MPAQAVALAPAPLTPSRGRKPVNRPSSHTGEKVAFGVGGVSLAALLAWLLWPRGKPSPSSCPPGQYLPAGASGCIPCPSGTVRSTGNPISQCLSCGVGLEPMADQSGCQPIPVPVLTPTCPPAGSIIRDATTGSMYAVDSNGVMHGITSLAALAACGYCSDASHVTNVSDATMQALVASCSQGADIDGSSTCVLGPALCTATPTPTPTGVCVGSDPGTSPNSPAWYAGASESTQIASLVFRVLLGRWPCNEPNDQHWTNIYNAPIGTSTGIATVAYEIIADAGCEFFNRITVAAGGNAIAVPDPDQYGICGAETPNGPDSYQPIGAYQWIPAAFQLILNRPIDPNWVATQQNWLAIYGDPEGAGAFGGSSIEERGWMALAMAFAASSEFYTDIVGYWGQGHIPGGSASGMVAAPALAVSTPGIL